MGLYGKLRKSPFGYCGEYLDKETGEIYLRARYYDPAAGRFHGEDPAQSRGNWYSYCGCDPVNLFDPFGLREVDWTSRQEQLEEEARQDNPLITPIYTPSMQPSGAPTVAPNPDAPKLFPTGFATTIVNSASSFLNMVALLQTDLRNRQNSTLARIRGGDASVPTQLYGIVTRETESTRSYYLDGGFLLGSVGFSVTAQTVEIGTPGVVTSFTELNNFETKVGIELMNSLCGIRIGLNSTEYDYFQELKLGAYFKLGVSVGADGLGATFSILDGRTEHPVSYDFEMKSGWLLPALCVCGALAPVGAAVAVPAAYYLITQTA